MAMCLVFRMLYLYLIFSTYHIYNRLSIQILLGDFGRGQGGQASVRPLLNETKCYLVSFVLKLN